MKWLGRQDLTVALQEFSPGIPLEKEKFALEQRAELSKQIRIRVKEGRINLHRYLDRVANLVSGG